MVASTARNRINELIIDQNDAEINRVSSELGYHLDNLTLRLMEIRVAVKDDTLRPRRMLELMEERARVEEDMVVARESLAYLKFRQRQYQERQLREQLRDLSQANEPSMYRKDLIDYLIRHHDVVEMKQLWNGLIEQRSRIIMNQETLEQAIQHFSLGGFVHYEIALSTVDDVLGALDNDISLLWQAIHRDL